MMMISRQRFATLQICYICVNWFNWNYGFAAVSLSPSFIYDTIQ